MVPPAVPPVGTELVAPADPTLPPPVAPDGTAPPAPKKRRRIGWIIAVILLALALIATGVILALSLFRLQQAGNLIDDQKQEIEEQQEIIEKKETFGAAASELMATAAQFDGLPYGDLVDTARITDVIESGWTDRWTGDLVDLHTEELRGITEELAAIQAGSQAQLASNASGTYYETLTDSLGSGYVTTSLDTADASCEDDVWGCVTGEEPMTIHYDNSQTGSEPYMNDFLRSGLAYHEYAHVLQFTNQEATEKAVESFGGDWETMADCYALTFLPGWTLDHTIYVSDFEYWEVSVGYGYTCDANQAQVVRDWVAGLGYKYAPISQ